jgi:putative chitinase
MAKLTDAFFKQIAPAVSPELRAEYAKWFNKYLFEFGITTERRIACAFGQFIPESGNLTRTEENLNYSARRLMVVWPKRFKTLDFAKQYEHNPQKLANYVYDGRNGNRPGTNDGWDFRGAALDQETGRSNYIKSGKLVGADFIAHPELLRTPEYAVKVACAGFKSRGCNELADSLSITAISERINGGHNGLADRKFWTNQCMALLPDGFELDTATSVKRTELSTTPIEMIHMPDEGTPGFLPHDEMDNNEPVAASNTQEAPELGGTAETGSEGQETQENSQSQTVKASITPEGGVNLESNTQKAGPQERVAVVAPLKKKWYQGLGTKIGTFVTGNAVFQWIWGQLDTIQGLHIPVAVWYIISGSVVVGGLVWIISEWKDTAKENDRQKELTALLVEQNSTQDNLAQVIPADEVDLYRARKFKIITRGDSVPQPAPPDNG